MSGIKGDSGELDDLDIYWVPKEDDDGEGKEDTGIEKNQICKKLRKALEEDREVSYEDYGEHKVVNLKDGDTTFRFYKQRDYDAPWVMEIIEKGQNYTNPIIIERQDDIDFLEKLFKQDISDNLRTALEVKGELEYQELYYSQSLKVKRGNKVYYFHHDPGREYADWGISVFDLDGNHLFADDIREDSDVMFLEKLYQQMLIDQQIQQETRGRIDDVMS